MALIEYKDKALDQSSAYWRQLCSALEAIGQRHVAPADYDALTAERDRAWRVHGDLLAACLKDGRAVFTKG